MNFLKKLSSVLLKATAIVTGFDPQFSGISSSASALVDKATSELEAIGNLVAIIEAAGEVLGTKGADKARAIAPSVAQIVLKSSLMAGKKIADPVAFQKACEALGGNIADLLNSLHEDGVKVENRT